MYEVTMDLTADWLKTVREIVRSIGDAQLGEAADEELAIHYFQLTMPAEQAQAAAKDALLRLREMDAMIRSHLESTIVPDIRKRTGYKGNKFHFCWVYNQGEHIVELESEYRIPL